MVVVIVVLVVAVVVVGESGGVGVGVGGGGAFKFANSFPILSQYTWGYFSVVRSRVIAQAVIRRPFSVEVGFDPTPAKVKLLMDKYFLQVFRCSPVTLIPQVFHIHPLIYHRINIIFALDSVVK